METHVRAKTPLFLLQALVNEIKTITEGMLFHTPKSTKLTSLEVYEQSLPIPTKSQEGEVCDSIDYEDGEEEEAVFKCPWCTVKVDGGNIPGINEMQSVDVVICFGIYNENENNQGHHEILNLFQKVYERFAVNPLLDSQYTCTGEFEWGLQDEDTYPYFFGAIGTTFKFTGYRRENKFL